jgi:methylated-DNA-[protein]-cysteine S-methyltransferase
MTTIWWSDVDTELGVFGLASSEQGLRALYLPDGSPSHEAAFQRTFRQDDLRPDDGHNAVAERQLREYLAGERRVFELPLDPVGTPFQRQVWEALWEIPYGEVTTYGEIARRIGNPKSVRAVGAANGANPIAVILPCHRVIGSDGSLTGYGGGLPLKRKLLELEGVRAPGDSGYRQSVLTA